MACRAKAAHGVELRIEHAKEHEAEVILFEQQALRATGALFRRGRHLRADLGKSAAKIVQKLPTPELLFVDDGSGGGHGPIKSHKA